MKKTIIATASAALAAFISVSANAGEIYANFGKVTIANNGTMPAPSALTLGYSSTTVEAAAINENIKVKNDWFAMFSTESTDTDNIGTLKQQVRSFGFDVRAIYSIPQVRGLSVDAKLGFGINWASLKGSGGYAATDTSAATGSGVQYGFGVGYAINDQFSVRGGYESYGAFRANSLAVGANGSAVNIGAAYKF